MNKQNLIKIIEELKEVRTETKSKVDDATLWDGAIRIHNSEEIELNKHKKWEGYEESNRQGQSKESHFRPPTSAPIFKPASDSQKRTLKNLGYSGEVENLSRSDAFKLLNARLPPNRK